MSYPLTRRSCEGRRQEIAGSKNYSVAKSTPSWRFHLQGRTHALLARKCSRLPVLILKTFCGVPNVIHPGGAAAVLCACRVVQKRFQATAGASRSARLVETSRGKAQFQTGMFDTETRRPSFEKARKRWLASADGNIIRAEGYYLRTKPPAHELPCRQLTAFSLPALNEGRPGVLYKPT